MEKIIEEAKKGDREAMDSLYRDYYDQVFLYVLKIFRDENKARDIVQDVFLRVFTHLKELKNTDAFQRWLYKITLNECRQCFRKEEKQVLIDEVDLLEQGDFFTIEESLYRKDAAEYLETIIGLLPEGQRRAVRLYYYEQMSIKEIAAMENVSENSVKSRLAQARKKIKTAVEAEKRRVGENDLPW